MSKAPVFQHFLTSSDDEKMWKMGKRAAEKDSVVGDLFSLQIQTPEDGKIDSTKHQVWLQERTRHNKQVSASVFRSNPLAMNLRVVLSYKQIHETITFC